jgi:hypothetical protein
METSIDRRGRLQQAAAGRARADTSNIVRHGILLRTCLGTMGAVEYLKAHGTDSTVITRVLTGEHVRGEDIRALAQRNADLERAS